MKLERQDITPHGIFSRLTDDHGQEYTTLEHAYCLGETIHCKIPNGTYTCVRGTHALHDGIPFQTFEITGVPGHKGLLFHKGNYNSDSEGCVLVGLSRDRDMIIHSKDAFDKFIKGLDGVNEFTLEVK